MKKQYILTQEEHKEIASIISRMDSYLGSIIYCSNNYDHIKDCAVNLSVLMSKLVGILE